MKKYLLPSDIDAVIVNEKYEHPAAGITICVLTLKNGARVIGVNYGAIDPERQDWTMGRNNSRAQAVEKVWELEGYLLRQRLMEDKNGQ